MEKNEDMKKAKANERPSLRTAVGESSVTITPEQTTIEGKEVNIVEGPFEKKIKEIEAVMEARRRIAADIIELMRKNDLNFKEARLVMAITKAMLEERNEKEKI
jgi:transcription antitermination factor NusG